MTAALTINIILAVAILTVVVAPLVWAIMTTRTAQTVAVARVRHARQRRVRAQGSYGRVSLQS
jgi:hypothetical protein